MNDMFKNQKKVMRLYTTVWISLSSPAPSQTGVLRIPGEWGNGELTRDPGGGEAEGTSHIVK